MTTRVWISCIVAVAGWVGFSVAPASAVAIGPITAAAGVTLEILNGDASTYLPEVSFDAAGNLVGKTVTLVATGVTAPVFSLAASTAYPGTCTNFSNPATDTVAGAPKADFELVGNLLTSWDCGGMATIRVTDPANGATYDFKLPQDANNNDIPDSWEAQFGGNLVRDADPDFDGHSNFDEYRGFIVSRKLVRGDPLRKDVFIFLVNPQLTGSLSIPGGNSLLGQPAGANRTVYPADGTSLTANINNLASVARVHLLGHKRDANGNLIFDGLNKTTDEMIDRLASFSVVSGRETFVYRNGTDPANANSLTAPLSTILTRTRSTPVDDREINKNRRFGARQRAMRLIESLDVSKTTPIGTSTWGSPNNLNESVIYTQRIENFVNTMTPTTDPMHYVTHDGTAWGTTYQLNVGRPFIISRYIQFVFAHEVGGHDTKLTTASSTLGNHDAMGTGGMMDSQVEVIPDGTPAGLKFRIPSIYFPGHLSGVTVAP